MLRYLFCNWNRKTPEPEPIDQDFEIKKIIMNGVLEDQSIGKVERFIIEKFGPEAMSYQDLEYYFYRYYNGKKGESYERSLVPKRPELLDLPENLIFKIAQELGVEERWSFGECSAQKCYRLASTTRFRERRMILCGVMKGKTMEQIIHFLNCDMAYQEMDFWYHYFYNGGRDLDYDRSLDPLPRQLTDLPNEMLDQILSNLPIVNRLQTYHVSRRFKALTDLRCTNLQIFRFIDILGTYYNGDGAWFQAGVLAESTRAYSDLGLVFKDPRLKLKYLLIGFEQEVLKSNNWQQIIKMEIYSVRRLLSSLSHQVHVEELRLENCQLKDLVTLLPYFKPGVLKSILCCNFIWAEETYPETLLELSRLAQWAQASKLVIRIGALTLVNFCLAQYFLHFQDISIVGGIVDIADFPWIHQLLHQSRALKRLEVETDFYFNDFCIILDQNIIIEQDSEEDGIAVWGIPRAGATYQIESSRYDENGLTEIVFLLKERRLITCSAKRRN